MYISCDNKEMKNTTKIYLTTNLSITMIPTSQKNKQKDTLSY